MATNEQNAIDRRMKRAVQIVGDRGTGEVPDVELTLAALDRVGERITAGQGAMIANNTANTDRIVSAIEGNSGSVKPRESVVKERAIVAGSGIGAGAGLMWLIDLARQVFMR